MEEEEELRKVLTLRNGEQIELKQIYKAVKEMLGNVDDQTMKNFMRSQNFKSVCPDFYEAFKALEEGERNRKVKEEATGTTTSSTPLTPPTSSPPIPGYSKQTLIKEEVLSDHENDDNNERKRKHDGNSSDNSSDRPHRHHHHHHKKKKKKHKKKRVRSISSSSSSSRDVDDKKNDKISETVPIKVEVKKEPLSPPPLPDIIANQGKKVHPFYLNPTPVLQVKGKLFESGVEQGPSSSSDNNNHIKKEKDKKHHRDKDKDNHHHHHRKREKERERERDRERHRPPPPKELKPFSYYSSLTSKIGTGKNWKPLRDSEHSKYERRYKLRPLSIVCTDLLQLGSIFYDPARGPPPSADAIPLRRSRHIPFLSSMKMETIEKKEKNKNNLFKGVLNRLYRKNRRRASGTSESEGHHDKSLKRPTIDSDSNSSGGGGGTMKRRQGQGNKGGFNKEENKKRLQQLQDKKKNNNKETRKLPWENRDYFNKKNEAARKEKEKKAEAAKIAKIPKISQNHTPTPILKILNDIEMKNKEIEKRGASELKIPKISEGGAMFRAKPAEKVEQGSVAVEVEKLLKTDTVVECPRMPAMSNLDAYTDYTIQKMAWWFLKEEAEPPEVGVWHPELHDNEIYDEWYDEKEHKKDDEISIGCVSDPEGLDEGPKPETDKKGKPRPVDPDKLDEYCGRSSLDLLIRMKRKDGKDAYVKFLKTKPETNYEKASFEAKCFLCDKKLVGTRHLGAHVRSADHKNKFREESLKLITQHELKEPQPYRKVFPAKLISYLKETTTCVVEDVDMGKPEQPANDDADAAERPDSPMAVIDTNEPVPQVELNVNDDNLSLASLTQYDLEMENAEELKAKICLRTNGFWTEDKERNWVLKEERKAMLINQYNDRRETYINNPMSFPTADAEWLKFWNMRGEELEKEGKDPDTYDYTAEWKPYWFKRVQEIMKEEAERQMLLMKRELSMDAQSLKSWCTLHGLNLDSFDADVPEPKISRSPRSRSTGHTSNHKKESVGSNEGKDHQFHQRNGGNNRPPAPPPPKISNSNNFKNSERRYGDNYHDGKQLSNRARRKQERNQRRRRKNDTHPRRENETHPRRENETHPRRDSRDVPPPFHGHDKQRRLSEEERTKATPKSFASPESDWEMDPVVQARQGVNSSRPTTATSSKSKFSKDSNSLCDWEDEDSKPAIPCSSEETRFVSQFDNRGQSRFPSGPCTPMDVPYPYSNDQAPTSMEIEPSFNFVPNNFHAKSNSISSNHDFDELLNFPSNFETPPSFLPAFDPSMAKGNQFKKVNNGNLAAAWAELQLAIESAEPVINKTVEPMTPFVPPPLPSPQLPPPPPPPPLPPCEDPLEPISPPSTPPPPPPPPPPKVDNDVSNSQINNNLGDPFQTTSPIDSDVDTSVIMGGDEESKDGLKKQFRERARDSSPEEGEVDSDASVGAQNKAKKKPKPKPAIDTTLFKSFGKQAFGYEMMKNLNNEGVLDVDERNSAAVKEARRRENQHPRRPSSGGHGGSHNRRNSHDRAFDYNSHR